ncbi:MAG: type II toxin-antitoxin system RelE/ParE family toxin [Nitrospiraceae bacterium]|nr:type II toxin-antitoxin system RelE/ParE family toxin [Nitrospiraceae bacterium]
MYRIAVKKSAKKEIDELPDHQFLKVDKAILALRENPYPYPQAKKLKGTDNFRLRVGDFRIVYSVDEDEKIVTVYRIRHRRDVYR